MPGFISWCNEHAAEVDQLGYVWHQPSYVNDGFYSRSHVVAYDATGVALTCAMLFWSEALAMPNIYRFLDRVRLATKSN